jgi:acyl-CoA dehydrogenase
MDVREILDPFDRMLSEVCTPLAVRAVECGGDHREMWQAFAQSGFLDALVPEEAGGFGLDFEVAGHLFALLGRHAVPLPVGETILARWLLATSGVDRPEGAIAIASAGLAGAMPVIGGRVADRLLIGGSQGVTLADMRALKLRPTALANDLSAWVEWSGDDRGQAVPAGHVALDVLAAILRAALIAGAAERVLEMTVDYARTRQQFGKAIGGQQVIQQNLAVMAEQMLAVRLAAQSAFATSQPNPDIAAIAKYVCSVHAVEIANGSHAIHGAIGISDAYDLQLFTRRLHAWRLADGAEQIWARRLGAQVLRGRAATAVDFIRECAAIA